MMGILGPDMTQNQYHPKVYYFPLLVCLEQQILNNSIFKMYLIIPVWDTWRKVLSTLFHIHELTDAIGCNTLTDRGESMPSLHDWKPEFRWQWHYWDSNLRSPEDIANAFLLVLLKSHL